MGNLPRVLALRQLRYSPFCVIAILLIAGWCGVAEGENDSLGAEDPGSLDRVIRRIHPKAPPLPREEERPPNSRLFNLGFEQGDWDVIIEDSASDSEVMVVYSYIKKNVQNPLLHAILSNGQRTVHAIHAHRHQRVLQVASRRMKKFSSRTDTTHICWRPRPPLPSLATAKPRFSFFCACTILPNERCGA